MIYHRLAIAALVSMFLIATGGYGMLSDIAAQEQTNQAPEIGTHQEQRSKEAAALRRSFGKASHVVVAAVIDAAVYKRSGEKLDNLPDTLGQRQYLELTLQVLHTIVPLQRQLSETIAIRLEAPRLTRLEVLGFLHQITNAKKIFFLKRDLRLKSDTFYYPADRVFFTDISRTAALETWAKQRAASTPEPPKGTKSYYRIPGVVFPELQEGEYDCWAAAAAMMLSWRDQVRYTKEEAAHIAGDTFTQILAAKSIDQGLTPASKSEFLAGIGLTAEALQTFLPRGLRDLLEEHGPLWVTVLPHFDVLTPHARVVIAIEGDDSPDNTFLTYLDPDPFAVVHKRQSVREFTQAFEQVATNDLIIARKRGIEIAKQPLRFQILHF